MVAPLNCCSRVRNRGVSRRDEEALEACSPWPRVRPRADALRRSLQGQPTASPRRKPRYRPLHRPAAPSEALAYEHGDHCEATETAVAMDTGREVVDGTVDCRKSVLEAPLDQPETRICACQISGH
jgi:hypothetical protein